MPVLATRSEVARLYGRAAFGATAANLDYGSKMPYHDLVLALFPSAPADVRPPAADESERVDFEGAASQNWQEMYGPITWWTERMRASAWPLEERMTLFWHDHFATAFSGGVTVDLLMIQNQLLRVHALGDFRALVKAVTVDPAMLNWLNGSDNCHWSVNENYARELMELFTVGVRPGGTREYTEADVRYAAQALTGWQHVDKDVDKGEIKAKSQFFADRHRAPVVVAGEEPSPWIVGVCRDGDHANDYARVVDAVLARPGADRHVAAQLVRSFGYVPDPVAVVNGQDTLVEKVAAALRPATPGGRWDIAAAVRALLLAEEFRGVQPPARQGARQPLETLAHAAKILGVDLYRWEWTKDGLPSNGDPTGIKIFDRTFVDASAQAGQMPFLPPGVGGWPAGGAWFSTMSNLSRYDILHRLWADFVKNPTGVVPPASGDLAGWTAFMGLAALSANTAAAVQSYLASPAAAGITLDAEKARQRGVFLLIGTSPDWQVM